LGRSPANAASTASAPSGMLMLNAFSLSPAPRLSIISISTAGNRKK
jgi:hypothetical protein